MQKGSNSKKSLNTGTPNNEPSRGDASRVSTNQSNKDKYPIQNVYLLISRLNNSKYVDSYSSVKSIIKSLNVWILLIARDLNF